MRTHALKPPWPLVSAWRPEAVRAACGRRAGSRLRRGRPGPGARAPRRPVRPAALPPPLGGLGSGRGSDARARSCQPCPRGGTRRRLWGVYPIKGDLGVGKMRRVSDAVTHARARGTRCERRRVSCARPLELVEHLLGTDRILGAVRRLGGQKTNLRFALKK